MKKIKARVAYKDETHRKGMDYYKALVRVYKTWIEEEDMEMIDFTYQRLCGIIDTLYFGGAIEHSRAWYLRRELDEMRGWVW